MMDEVSIFYKSDNNGQLASLEKIREDIEDDVGKNPLSKMWFFCYRYTIKNYCYDLLQNLKSGELNLVFDQMEIPPFDSWKKCYISIEDIDDFLYEDKLYWFVKQKVNKIEIRDKIKLIESGAVKNLSFLIDYDLQWMENFDVDNGLILNRGYDGKIYIYPLKIAVIIKTYNDLVNKYKIKIKSGIKEKKQPLRTAIHATLPIRIFLLACHSQYLNATEPRGIYKLRFLNEFLYPEMETMETIMEIFQ